MRKRQFCRFLQTEKSQAPFLLEIDEQPGSKRCPYLKRTSTSTSRHFPERYYPDSNKRGAFIDSASSSSLWSLQTTNHSCKLFTLWPKEHTARVRSHRWYMGGEEPDIGGVVFRNGQWDVVVQAHVPHPGLSHHNNSVDSPAVNGQRAGCALLPSLEHTHELAEIGEPTGSRFFGGTIQSSSIASRTIRTSPRIQQRRHTVIALRPRTPDPKVLPQVLLSSLGPRFSQKSVQESPK